jgi:hypothetical protein
MEERDILELVYFLGCLGASHSSTFPSAPTFERNRQVRPTSSRRSRNEPSAKDLILGASFPLKLANNTLSSPCPRKISTTQHLISRKLQVRFGYTVLRSWSSVKERIILRSSFTACWEVGRRVGSWAISWSTKGPKRDLTSL